MRILSAIFLGKEPINYLHVTRRLLMHSRKELNRNEIERRIWQELKNWPMKERRRQISIIEAKRL